jgi:hypothetical protein
MSILNSEVRFGRRKNWFIELDSSGTRIALPLKEEQIDFEVVMSQSRIR